MKSYRFVTALSLIVMAVAAVPSIRAEQTCSASVRAIPRADQITDEAIIKVWAVEVDTHEACAKVYVDAVMTERLFNGEEIKSTRRGWRKVSNHTSTYKVNYRIEKDSTLVSSEFKLSKCV